LQELHRELADHDRIPRLDRRRLPRPNLRAVDQHRIRLRDHREHMPRPLQIDERMHARDVLLGVVKVHGALGTAADGHA
jgi:hypothetical protein